MGRSAGATLDSLLRAWFATGIGVHNFFADMARALKTHRRDLANAWQVGAALYAIRVMKDTTLITINVCLTNRAIRTRAFMEPAW